jgi:PST family polysaccharide transporter
VGTLANTCVTTLAMWIYAPVRIRPVFRPSGARHIFKFGGHLTGAIVLNYFSRNTDNLLVGRYLGSTPLGFYQMGYMLMTYPLQNFTTVVSQVVYPALARFPDDLDRLRAAYLRTCRLIAMPIFPIMLGLAVTAPSFVWFFLGARWMAVAPLLMVFAPLGAAQALYGTVGLIYNTQGRPDIQLRWTAFSSVMYVLSFVAGLRWGIVGVAVSYALMWTVLMVPSFVIPFRLIKLTGRKFVQTLWPTIWSSLAMAGVSWAWLRTLHQLGIHNSLAELLSATIVGGSVYVGLTLWRKPLVLFDLGNTLVGLPGAFNARCGNYVLKLAGRAGEQGLASLPGPTTAPD